ncbi:MAG: barstar family protein [Lachnospiraceae bacterium]|jgi:RNAse (barnase) inhibitor barstar|nr:barstar family protein [Lachnospiraceae bacterium]
MKEIIIECSEMETKSQAMEALGKSLMARGGISDLDSLYECLVGLDEPVEITFEDVDLLDVYLGEFGEELLATFEQAAKENENIELI